MENIKLEMPNLITYVEEQNIYDYIPQHSKALWRKFVQSNESIEKFRRCYSLSP